MATARVGFSFGSFPYPPTTHRQRRAARLVQTRRTVTVGDPARDTARRAGWLKFRYMS